MPFFPVVIIAVLFIVSLVTPNQMNTYGQSVYMQKAGKCEAAEWDCLECDNS